jgi:hypothetical protein
MSSLTMNGTTRSRTVLTLLAFFGASMAFAQPTELPNRRDVLEGITTAGQPSQAALSAAAAAGYKSVIDLRAPSEDRGLDEKAAVESLGMSYMNLPVDGSGGVSYANASALDRLLPKLRSLCSCIAPAAIEWARCSRCAPKYTERTTRPRSSSAPRAASAACSPSWNRSSRPGTTDRPRRQKAATALESCATELPAPAEDTAHRRELRRLAPKHRKNPLRAIAKIR